MADMYGRLTRARRRLPGHARARARRTSSPASPTPSSTARRWSRSPARRDLERMHKESHQYIDVVDDDAADHEVERAAELRARHPRGGAQGVQGRRGAEARARPTSSCPRTSWRADGRRRAAARAARRFAGPSRARDELLRRRRGHPRRRAPDRAGRQRRRPRRRRARAARVRARDRHRRGRDVHGQGRCSTTRTRTRSARSACSRATTRWPASRTPTS